MHIAILGTELMGRSVAKPPWPLSASLSAPTGRIHPPSREATAVKPWGSTARAADLVMGAGIVRQPPGPMVRLFNVRGRERTRHAVTAGGQTDRAVSRPHGPHGCSVATRFERSRRAVGFFLSTPWWPTLGWGSIAAWTALRSVGPQGSKPNCEVHSP